MCATGPAAALAVPLYAERLSSATPRRPPSDYALPRQRQWPDAVGHGTRQRRRSAARAQGDRWLRLDQRSRRARHRLLLARLQHVRHDFVEGASSVATARLNDIFGQRSDDPSLALFHALPLEMR